MKIGFFGGTFDPIHMGHLNLAVNIKERANLDEIWFCPAYQNPFKNGMKSASPKARIEMITLAIQGAPGFKLLDYEITRESPSYTIDTIRHLIDTTGHSFMLILGQDQIQNLSKWKEVDALLELAPPIFASRGAGTGPAAFDIPLFDVSATEVRSRVKAGQWIGHLVPTQVNTYIQEGGLYLHD